MNRQMLNGGHETLLQQGNGLQHVGETPGMLERLVDFGRDVISPSRDSGRAVCFQGFCQGGGGGFNPG